MVLKNNDGSNCATNIIYVFTAKMFLKFSVFLHKTHTNYCRLAKYFQYYGIEYRNLFIDTKIRLGMIQPLSNLGISQENGKAKILHWTRIR